MPELPEVEFARRCLARWLGKKRVAQVEGEATRVLRGASVPALEALSGHVLQSVDRRGKQLFLRFDGGQGLLAHLGMTGKFVLQKPRDPEVRWSRARFVREDGATVHFQDARMFGRLQPGPLAELEEEEAWSALGPDAWDHPPTAQALQERLGGRKRAIKDVLMDQSLLAGLGNIQVTEALFRAGIHPARAAASLSAEEWERLVAGIRWTLERTIAMNKGDKISYVEEGVEDNPFVVYGRAGEPCPSCGTELEKVIIGGRTSVFCPHDQPLRVRRIARPTSSTRRR